MSNEEFATDYEKEYFYFYYALQSEEKNIRNYVKCVEALFEELEYEIKKLAKGGNLAILRFSRLDSPTSYSPYIKSTFCWFTS